MDPLAENVKRIQERIEAAAARSGRPGAAIRLVAVSKTVEPARIGAALAAGIREIGENYIQEAVAKFPDLEDHSYIRHFIGHLQRNKAARAAQFFDVIQSIDSESLARAVGRHAETAGKTVEALIEVNIAGEASKFGVRPDQTLSLAEAMAAVAGLRLVGLMGIGPLEGTAEETRRAFRTLARLFDQLPVAHRRVLSMGMSGDFEPAIEEGSTMVRIGTGIFGLRRNTA